MAGQQAAIRTNVARVKAGQMLFCALESARVTIRGANRTPGKQSVDTRIPQC